MRWRISLPKLRRFVESDLVYRLHAVDGTGVFRWRSCAERLCHFAFRSCAPCRAWHDASINREGAMRWHVSIAALVVVGGLGLSAMLLAGRAEVNAAPLAGGVLAD